MASALLCRQQPRDLDRLPLAAPAGRLDVSHLKHTGDTGKRLDATGLDFANDCYGRGIRLGRVGGVGRPRIGHRLSRNGATQLSTAGFGNLQGGLRPLANSARFVLSHTDATGLSNESNSVGFAFSRLSGTTSD